MREAFAKCAARIVERSPLGLSVLKRRDFPGRWRIINALNPHQLPQSVLTDVHGLRLQLDLRDYIQRETYFGRYEPETLRALATLVRPGDRVWDIGANVGVIALTLAQLGAFVEAFEPSPAVVARLRANSILNPTLADHLHIHSIAVGDQDGDVTFYATPDHGSGWGSVAHFPDIPSTPIRVPMTTLDHLWVDHERLHLRLIKMDIEGFEVEALKGAASMLTAHSVDYLVLEFNGPRLAERGRSWQDFAAPLHDAGYRPRPDVLVDPALDRLLENPAHAEKTLTNVCWVGPHVPAASSAVFPM